MSHELLKLTSKLCNTPHLITEDYLDKVFQLLEVRNQGTQLGAVGDIVSPRKRSLQYFADKSLGVIDIHGAISDVPYYGMCGEDGVSHQAIREEMKALVDAGAKVIVLDEDTNGGMVHMAFESANYIRNLADENDVKLISYVSHKAFSAGYVYAAVAHEIISNPSAEVGSIGVMAKLRNVSGTMKNMGVKDVYVTAGDNKVPFNEDGEFTQAFLKEVQDSVLETYDQFTGHVAMWRGIEQKDVIALGANSFSVKKGLENGLVDKEMTLEEFKAYLEEVTTMTNPVSSLFTKKTQVTKPTKEAAMPDQNVEMQAALEELRAEFTAKLDKSEADKAASLSQMKAELETAQSALAAVKLAEKETKSASRLATLKAEFGEVEAPLLNTSLEALDDKAFETVVNSLKAKADKQEATMTKEHGSDGKQVVDDETTMTKEKLADKEQARLEAKYNSKRK